MILSDQRICQENNMPVLFIENAETIKNGDARQKIKLPQVVFVKH